jgi:hypothetical protein
MNYKMKIIIYLFVLLLFVFILGTNILQIEGLTTIEEIKQRHDSQISVNNSNVDLNSKQSYDNYNHYNQTYIPTIFYGENQSKVILDTKTKTLYLIDISGNTTTYSSNRKNTPPRTINIENDLTNISFYSENGSVATIHRENNIFIKITDNNGNIQLYKVDYTPATIETLDYNNSPTTYYGSTGEHIPPMSIIKEFNDNDKSDLYILKSKIVPPLCPVNKIQVIHDTDINPDVKVKDETQTPIISCQNNTNDFSGNLFQTPSQYKPHLTSYASSQVEGNKFNKFKSVNSINSEFMPIPVLNSFHSFGK